ncbi:MAG: acyl-protein synthetase [Actinomycetota bacterium]
MTLEELLSAPQYSLDHDTKQEILLEELNALTAHHARRGADYRRLLDVFGHDVRAASLARVPYLPVSLFKSHDLLSIPSDEVFKTMTSSGTTGAEVSRIYLDAATAQLQARALASIMTSVLGPQRLPMIVVDSPGVVRDRKRFNARAAGVLGMLNFGARHLYALDDDMELDVAGLDAWLERHGDRPFLMFGFTFMVWQYLYKRVAGLDLDLSNGILVHSGGWKKLRDEAVDNEQFKDALKSATGLRRVYNFYGMIEQVGSVFLEGDDGFLYPPNFGDVIVRDPDTWEEAPLGKAGVIQVVSALPRSYPGHSLLTEDLGVVHGVDDSVTGRRGKRFSVIGRVPKVELRGCSDTHAYSRGAA